MPDYSEAVHPDNRTVTVTCTRTGRQVTESVSRLKSLNLLLAYQTLNGR